MIKAYIGKMRSGKTLAMTQEVLKLLNNGEVVYTNYKINWDPQAPMSPFRKALHFLGYRKKRYPKTNLRTFHDWEQVQNVSNCTVALDEGWQYFDSYNKLPIEKRMRLYQSGKWELNFLYTVQRYMMTDINLRWSTNEFWESTLYKIPFISYPVVIYRLYDLDEDGESAKLARKGIDEKGNVVDLALKRKLVFTTKRMFHAYDTKEDIYATEHYRHALSKKVDSRGSDSDGYFDSAPTLIDIIKRIGKKHDARSNTRTTSASPASIPSPVVARVHSRNNIINNVVDRDLSFSRVVSQKIYSTPQKKAPVKLRVYHEN